ncbi:hypothetical protein [Tsuneonella sp. HG222]
MAAALMSWPFAPDPRVRQPTLQFERQAAFDPAEVSKCIEYALERVFPEFDRVTAFRDHAAPLNATYLAEDGSKLSVARQGRSSIVKFSSSVAISAAQRDVLEWCSVTPGTTWIPRSLR